MPGIFGFLRQLETRKKLLLLCLGATDMMAYINISLLAPFFPFEVSFCDENLKKLNYWNIMQPEFQIMAHSSKSKVFRPIAGGVEGFERVSGRLDLRRGIIRRVPHTSPLELRAAARWLPLPLSVCALLLFWLHHPIRVCFLPNRKAEIVGILTLHLIQL